MSKNVVEVFLDGQKLLVRQMEVSYSSSDLPVVSVEAMIPPEPQKQKEPTIIKGPFELRWGDQVLKEAESEAVLPDYSGFSRAEYSAEVTVHVDEDAADTIAYMLEDREKRNIKIKELKEMSYRDEDSCAKECETACDNGYGAHSLAKRVVDLDLDDEEKLIRKYNLVRDDGTLTERGRELLLTILFDTYREEVVEKLEALEEAEKPRSED